MVEAGIATGLNVIDAFTAATGNRTLNREYKSELATANKARRRYQARLDTIHFGAIAGAGAAEALALGAATSCEPRKPQELKAKDTPRSPTRELFVATLRTITRRTGFATYVPMLCLRRSATNPRVL